jgi:hypothetical protein
MKRNTASSGFGARSSAAAPGLPQAHWRASLCRGGLRVSCVVASNSTLEFDGVELAAIQGLGRKMEERDRALKDQLKEKDAEIQQLEQAVNHLKELVNHLAAKQSKTQ